jgi:Ca2+-binding RTX toxin-like protein
MTTTPTIWKAEFTVNAGNTAGTQSDPVTIGLADGRFLTAWVDDTNNVDDRDGTDIIGQIYGVDGSPIGNPFRLNFTFNSDIEGDPTLAALPDGGFVVVYEDLGSDNYVSTRFDRYDASGTRTEGGTIEGGSPSTGTNANPTVLVLPGGDYAVVYESHAGGDTNLLSRLVNGVSNNVGSPLLAAGVANYDENNPDSALLSNGNIATVYELLGPDEVWVHIRNTAGGSLGGGKIVDGSIDPHIAALAGGGFAVAWQDQASNGDIRAEVRDNNGGVVKSSFLVQGGTNSQVEPEIVGLKGGGFFVAWNDDTASLLRGQRFSATGVAIGTTLTIATGLLAGEPELGLTDDGRILVTFKNAAGEIGQVILDPRDKVIIGDNTAETITSRIDGATVNGLGGSDTLLGMGAPDILNGSTGADVMRGGGGNDVCHVDNAGDIVTEVGGTGTDTVIGSISFSLANTVRVLGSVENLVLSNVAAATSAIGNGLANVITGNSFGNVMNGGAGNDVLRGLSGNDSLNGGLGADLLQGGLGNDVFFIDSAADRAMEIAGQGTDTVYAAASYTLLANQQIEFLRAQVGASTTALNLTGNAFANTLAGNNGANVLDGGLGNDVLVGLAGNDRLIGNAGRDVSTGGAGNDVVRFAAASHSVPGASADVITDFDDFGNDTIDLAAVYGGVLAYRHNLAFTAAGQVRINDIAGADVIVEVNINANLAADMQIRLTATALAAMSAGDFVL